MTISFIETFSSNSLIKSLTLPCYKTAIASSAVSSTTKKMEKTEINIPIKNFMTYYKFNQNFLKI